MAQKASMDECGKSRKTLPYKLLQYDVRSDNLVTGSHLPKSTIHC